ncbi:MAG: galactosyltransferase-related protein [Cyanobacteria bacterium P01_D01_bin.105]
MAIVPVDIILPVQNRDTLLMVASTILSEMAAVEHTALGQLLVCDGGSTDPTCLRQIETVSQWEKVRVLHCKHAECSAEFNKSWLMNQGLAAATAEVVLISDVDILWEAAVLEAIALSAAKHPQRVYSVLKVKESDPAAVAVRRQRYTYRIEESATHTLVEICPAVIGEKTRPGCGMVCAQRQVFEHVGGYKTCFMGWGWEDQDFLIRAQLLGYEVSALGTVVHLSHGDAQRHSAAESIEKSRDRNIMRCLRALKEGDLRGDLTAARLQERPSDRTISVRYPPDLDSLQSQ